MDITTREGKTLEAAIAEAIELNQKRNATGFNQKALDDAARVGFANAAFELSEEELPEILEDFFPLENPATTEPLTIPVGLKTLKGKLGAKVEAFQASDS